MTKKSALFLYGLFIFFTMASTPTPGPPVRVGIYQNKPLVFIDEAGRPQGIYVDLLTYIADEEGWGLEFVICDWANCLNLLEAGNIDLMTAIAYSPERATKFAFNQQIVITNWAEIYTPPDSDIQSLLDLQDKSVAVLADDIHYQSLQELLHKFDIPVNFVEVNSYDTVFEQVAQHKVDAGLVNRLYGVEHRREFNIQRTPIIFNPLEVKFVAPKQNNPNLLNTLDSYLSRLKQDPTSIYVTIQTEV